MASTLTLYTNVSGRAKVKMRLWSASLCAHPPSSEAAWDERYTDDAGHGSFMLVPPGLSTVFFSADGYQDHAATFDMPDDGAKDIILERDILVPGKVWVEGQHFYDYEGPWLYRACTDFLLFQRFLNSEDTDSICDERYALGFRTLRVFLMCKNISDFKPNYLMSDLSAFAQYLNLKGFVPQFDVFADAQYQMPDEAQQRVFFDQVQEALDPHSFIGSLGNEYPQNGFHPNQFSRPERPCWSKGSGLGDNHDGSYHRMRPYWDWFDWHGRRDWPKVTSSTEDMRYLMDGANASGHYVYPKCCGVHGEPIGFAEIEEPNRRSTNPKLAHQVAVSSVVLGAGGCFHSSDGIQSRPFGPVTTYCAEAFVKGLAA